MLTTLFLALGILTSDPANVELVASAYDLFVECTDVVCDSDDHCAPTWSSASDPTCNAVSLVKLVSRPTDDSAAGSAAYLAAAHATREPTPIYVDTCSNDGWCYLFGGLTDADDWGPIAVRRAALPACARPEMYFLGSRCIAPRAEPSHSDYCPAGGAAYRDAR